MIRFPTDRVKRAIPASFVGLLSMLPACGDAEPDAYGNFEAEEVVVSAEADGRLLEFEVREGESLAAGARVGLVDTIQAALERSELAALLESSRSATVQAGAEVRALEAELATAERDLGRTERLYADEAATSQQLDAAATRVAVLRARFAGANSRTQGSAEQVEAMRVRVARLEDRLARSRVMNPVAGTVLGSFAEAGEFVRAGQPLYQVAALDTLTLRIYVDGTQLANIGVGQEVEVRFDDASEQGASVPGVVSWIASEAEFTPTPVQTREERTSLVYAVKIRVPNSHGRLKLGMPADVTLSAGGVDRAE